MNTAKEFQLSRATDTMAFLIRVCCEANESSKRKEMEKMKVGKYLFVVHIVLLRRKADMDLAIRFLGTQTVTEPKISRSVFI